MSEAELYFSEWTMPDGTKRAPLVVRVPECVPTRPIANSTAVLQFFPQPENIYTATEKRIGPWWVAEDIDTSVSVGNVEAAALCRCAVEDWLRKHGTLELYDDPHRKPVTFIPPRPWPQVYQSFDGPTIHHALIAAAHAVADALEAPKETD